MFKKKKKQIQIAPRKLVSSINCPSIISEQYRTVRANINFSMPDKTLETILFTSASHGEGKSTIAANAAIVFAQEGKKVLLVDADMRRPTMHYTFHTTNSPGLSDLLTRQWIFEDIVKKTEVPGLHLITSGRIPSNPAGLLSSKSMDTIIEYFNQKYDFVIFDAPPVLSVVDTQILSNKCNGTILVICSQTSVKENVIRAKETLQNSKANIIGTVLNNFKLEKNHYYHQY